MTALAHQKQRFSPPVVLTKETWPPNYRDVYGWRAQKLNTLRRKPEYMDSVKSFYKTHPVNFICDWLTTYDPRNAGSDDIPSKMPFVLFQRQAEMVQFLYWMTMKEQSGLIEKCRDMGATWVCCAFSVWLWLFFPGSAIGWGSRKEQLVDRIGDPDSIFEKMRIMLNELPKEFLPKGFSLATHATYMKIINPENGSTITGEAGDNIGRGGRQLIYFKDESAHYERPEKIEAALSDTTRVQIDISSVNGTGNVFYRRRESGMDWSPGMKPAKGRVNVFVMDWSDHPMKTQQWYDDRRAKAEAEGMLHIFAQEVERNYAAAVEGVIIPAEWVNSAVDAHLKLGFDDSGGWCAALDVADEGTDTNAIAARKGCILKKVEEWGSRDVGVTARKAVHICRDLGSIQLQYDCIGVGSAVKSETNRLIEEGDMPKNIRMVAWNAAAEVEDPEARIIPRDKDSPINKDHYQNRKAQGWFKLRHKFLITHRAVTEPGFTYDPDDLISIPSDLPLLSKIKKELSQPVMKLSAKMKVMVDKTPEGTRSPNIADSIMMVYFPVKVSRPVIVPDAVMDRLTAMRAMRRR